jgi:hypothetical protein
MESSLEFSVPLGYLKEKGLNEEDFKSMDKRTEELWLRAYYREKKEGITIYVIDENYITPNSQLYYKNIVKLWHPDSFNSFGEYSYDRYKKWQDMRKFVKENFYLFGRKVMEYREIDKWSIVDLTIEEVCTNCSLVVNNGGLTSFKNNTNFCEYCINKLKNENQNLYDYGYIYFFQELNTGKIKIGKTKNLENRIKNLKSMLPFKSELVHHIPTSNHSDVEKYFHRKYRSKKVKGEWFDLNEDDIVFIKKFKKEDLLITLLKESHLKWTI